MTGARILLADDDPGLREALEQVLAAGGYALVTVADGTRALEAVRADPPDLIILDQVMPGLDGLAVVQALHADPRLRAIPVILLTGAALDVPPGLRVAAIIQKPFRLNSFEDTIRSVLMSAPGG